MHVTPFLLAPIDHPIFGVNHFAPAMTTYIALLESDRKKLYTI